MILIEIFLNYFDIDASLRFYDDMTLYDKCISKAWTLSQRIIIVVCALMLDIGV